MKIVKSESLPIRQTYTRTLKILGLSQRFRNHPKNKKKARKADKKVKIIAGRLARELERNLPISSGCLSKLELFRRILSQERGDKHKIYSIHEPEVMCISKGKEYKKYEFGNKVSIIYSLRGVILDALSFRNEYEGHIIGKSLEQVRLLTGKIPKVLAGDRGYRGKKQSVETQIVIPATPSSRDSRCQREKKRKLFCKKAGIEAVIGHLKSDYRLGRNFHKGIVGDTLNVMLAAAAYNFKRAMKVLWLYTILRFTERLFEKISDRYKNTTIRYYYC